MSTYADGLENSQQAREIGDAIINCLDRRLEEFERGAKRADAVSVRYRHACWILFVVVYSRPVSLTGSVGKGFRVVVCLRRRALVVEPKTRRRCLNSLVVFVWLALFRGLRNRRGRNCLDLQRMRGLDTLGVVVSFDIFARGICIWQQWKCEAVLFWML